jgi:hypothetical protein
LALDVLLRHTKVIAGSAFVNVWTVLQLCGGDCDFGQEAEVKERKFLGLLEGQAGRSHFSFLASEVLEGKRRVIVCSCFWNLGLFCHFAEVAARGGDFCGLRSQFFFCPRPGWL